MFAEREDGPGGLGWCFTDRHGGVTPGPMGSLNLGRVGIDTADNVLANAARVADTIGLDRLVAVSQVHGTDVLVVDNAYLDGWTPTRFVGDAVSGQPASPVADAVVTDLPDVVLTIRAADCLPVVFTDADGPVIGVAHAGREGLRRGVLAAAVAAMRRLGAGRIGAVVGPHVCGACYEVPTEMATSFWAAIPASRATTSWGAASLDLGAAARAQLEELGCTVRAVARCTRTDSDLHSHRRDGGAAGRLAGMVWRVSGRRPTGDPRPSR